MSPNRPQRFDRACGRAGVWAARRECDGIVGNAGALAGLGLRRMLLVAVMAGSVTCTFAQPDGRPSRKPAAAVAADEPTQFLNDGADAGPQVPLNYPFPKLRKHRKGVLDVDFAHLSCFNFTPPDDPARQRNGERKRIPWEVVALDGQLVRIRGYMMATQTSDEGRATECVIVRDTLVCCYGQSPGPNEWVLVKIREPGAVVLENVPLYFYGRLHVGEIYENGAFAGLYRLECDRVTMGE